jgi:hypothetical protein
MATSRVTRRLKQHDERSGGKRDERPHKAVTSPMQPDRGVEEPGSQWPKRPLAVDALHDALPLEGLAHEPTILGEEDRAPATERDTGTRQSGSVKGRPPIHGSTVSEEGGIGKRRQTPQRNPWHDVTVLRGFDALVFRSYARFSCRHSLGVVHPAAHDVLCGVGGPKGRALGVYAIVILPRIPVPVVTVVAEGLHAPGRGVGVPALQEGQHAWAMRCLK